MSLAESQKFYFELMSRPETIRDMQKDRSDVLTRHFKATKDQQFLATYDDERFETYRRHISIGLFDWLDMGFPAIQAILTDEEWLSLLNDFFLAGYNRSPISRDVIFAFGDYLRHYQGPLLEKFPFLTELAEYEQLDIKLIFANDIQLDKEWVTAPPDNPLALIPILNPLLELREYSWPVHQIGPDNSDASQMTRGPYPLVIYRDPKSLLARCVTGNPQLSTLIKQLGSGKNTLGDILRALASTANIPANESETFSKEAIQMIDTLLQKGIVLGMTLS